MPGKTMIGGTVYDVTPGGILIAGTFRNISYGKTMVGGTAYDVEFSKPEVSVSIKKGSPYLGMAVQQTYTYVEINGTKYSPEQTLTLTNGTKIKCVAYKNGDSGGVYLNDVKQSSNPFEFEATKDVEIEISAGSSYNYSIIKVTM